MESRILLEDFSRAVTQLEKALTVPAGSDLVRAGCIQYFEFSFELAWKTIKSFAEDQGLPGSVSPKSCLKTAFSSGWLDDENVWLDMLSARNRMSHTYNVEHAVDIYSELPHYLDALKLLVGKLKTLNI